MGELTVPEPGDGIRSCLAYWGGLDPIVELCGRRAVELRFHPDGSEGLYPGG